MIPDPSGQRLRLGRTTRRAARALGALVRGRFVALAIAALALGPVTAALASDRGPALNWVRLPGAESCVAPVELTEQVERRLGRAVFVRARDAIVVIEGRVEPSQPLGFSVVLQVSDPDGTSYGTRELTLADADCRKLDEVVSLIIAVTIRHGSGDAGIALPYSVARELDRLFEDDSSELDPNSLRSPTGPPPMAANGTGATGSPAATGNARLKTGAGDVSVTDASAGERSAHATGSSVGWDVTTGVAFVSGLQPEFTFGPIIAGRVSIGGLGSIGLTLTAGLPKDQTLSGGEVGTLEYSVLAARLALCAPSWSVGSSELAGCILAGVGNVHVRGRNFEARNDSGDELWADVGPQLVGRVEVFGPAFVQLSLAAPIRLRAPEFAYTSSAGRTTEAFSMARVGLQAEIAVGIRL